MPPTSSRDCSLNQNLISAHPTYRPGTHAQISAPCNTVGNLDQILNAKSSTHIHASPITSEFCTHTVTDMETNMARRLATVSRLAGTCASASSYAVELWRQKKKQRNNGYVHLSSYQLNRLPVRFTEDTRARAESSRKRGKAQRELMRNHGNLQSQKLACRTYPSYLDACLEEPASHSASPVSP